MNPHATVWELCSGTIRSRALGLAAELRIAEALADGPRPVEELARTSAADPDAVRRVLRALASDGVFVEGPPGTFANTPASELLLGGWGAFARLFGDTFHRTIGGLDASGEPSFARLHGTGFWSWLATKPEERALFDRAMAHGKERRVETLAGLEWRGDETVVDVGGGNGALLLGLVDRVPGIRGVVLDRDETTRDEAVFGGRVTFESGDFFERVPPGDVHLLSGILHDWDDERAAAILNAVHAASAHGGRLLVLDSVVAPGNDPDGAKWLDLLMLALAGGRERDEAQWRALLAAAGFAPARIEDGLIEARREP